MGIAYDRGNLLYQHRRYELALREFLEELALTPTNAAVLSMVALCRLNLGQYVAAREAAEQAIAAHPDFDWGHYALAWTFYLDKKFDCLRAGDITPGESPKFRRLMLAKGAIEEALRLSPENVDILVLKSWIHYERLDLGLALEAANSGLAKDPTSAECQHVKAFVLRSWGDLAGATAASRAALAAEPESATIHSTAGWTALDAGDYRRAYEHFVEVLRLNPDLAQARTGLMHALRGRMVFFRLLLRMQLLAQRPGKPGRFFPSAARILPVLGIAVGVTAGQLMSGISEEQQMRVVLLFFGILFGVATLVLGSYFVANYVVLWHPVGRMVMARGEKIASIVISGLLPAIILANPIWFLVFKPVVVGAAIAAALVAGVVVLMLPAWYVQRRSVRATAAP